PTWPGRSTAEVARDRALVHFRAMTAPTDIPEAFRAVLAGLEEQQRPPAADTFLKCFGCGPEHPDGLYVRGFRTEEGVLSPVIISRRYEGPPGAAHGGIIAAYMDELLGAAAFRGTGKIAVTGALTVRYAAPAPPARRSSRQSPGGTRADAGRRARRCTPSARRGCSACAP